MEERGEGVEEWRGEMSARKEVKGGVVEEGEGKKRFIPLTTHRVHTSHLLSQ